MLPSCRERSTPELQPKCEKGLSGNRVILVEQIGGRMIDLKTAGSEPEALEFNIQIPREQTPVSQIQRSGPRNILARFAGYFRFASFGAIDTPQIQAD
jgi:hypothetical protein